MNATVAEKSHRGTIFMEEGQILAHEAFAANQFILRISAPKCARAAVPGSFAHIRCDDELPMRRPLSIMRADTGQGAIEILYKVIGPGLNLLSKKQVGDRLSIMGPIGRGFEPHPQRPRTLLVGGGVGIPPMIFLAERLIARSDAAWNPLVFMGSEVPFPFRLRPSTILVPGLQDGVIACMPLLDEWGVPSRLASLADFPGCYSGYVTELAAAWLSSLDPATLNEVAMFACGPTPMLKAMAQVAHRFGIPCQVSLEEFMACAVGGCAGCALRVETPDGPAMKRVCVDGPVFEASTVFPAS